MAETNNGETGKIGGKSAADNTTVTTRGGESGSTGNLSSNTTADAKIDGKTLAVADNTNLLPYPHNALQNLNTEATSYRDLIKDVYAEHEKELKSDKGNVYEPSAEMLAARDDAQVRLADELRASLKAQRSMTARNAQEGAIKIKLTSPHIHAGVAYEAGDEISVDETSAKFIEAAKAGKRV